MRNKRTSGDPRFAELVRRMCGARVHPEGVLIPRANLADILTLAGALHAVYMGRKTAAEAVGQPKRDRGRPSENDGMIAFRYWASRVEDPDWKPGALAKILAREHGKNAATITRIANTRRDQVLAMLEAGGNDTAPVRAQLALRSKGGNRRK
jgi:uncharacterized membrane protein